MLIKDAKNGQLLLNLPAAEDLPTVGIQILKASGRSLKMEIDTALCPLEPIIAALMQHCHIIDMTVSDPPMEEIIAAIYREQAGMVPLRETSLEGGC